MTTETPEILFLGAEGSGKSLLIRRICEISKLKTKLTSNLQLCQSECELSPENTVPTIGVELATLTMESSTFNLREVGATMASRWESYYKDCSAVVFVVDASDLSSVGSAMALLAEVLSNMSILASQSILIVLSKTDLVDPITLTIVENTLRLEELSLNILDLCVLRGSTLDGSLALLVLEWVDSYVSI